MHPEDSPMLGRVGRVFAFLDGLIEALPVPPNHRELLQTHLTSSRERAESSPQMSAVQLPLLVHAAVAGDERPAVPVAGACTLLRLGTDLFDGVLDRELPLSWDGREPAEPILAATTLGAALPQISIARLQEQGTPPDRLWALSRLLAETLLAMSAGEHEDLMLPEAEDASLEESRAMVERKSGSEAATFAKAGALLATGDARVIGSYASFGLCFGIAKQLVSDVWDLWSPGASRDLLNGKRTLPVVHALQTLRGEKRERLRGLLVEARESGDHHDEVRRLLLASESVRYTALIVWLYGQQARKHLALARPMQPAAGELRWMLDQTTLLPQTRTAVAPDQ